MSSVIGSEGKIGKITLCGDGKDLYEVEGRIGEWDLGYERFLDGEIFPNSLELSIMPCKITVLIEEDKYLSDCTTQELVDELNDRLGSDVQLGENKRR